MLCRGVTWQLGLWIVFAEIVLWLQTFVLGLPPFCHHLARPPKACLCGPCPLAPQAGLPDPRCAARLQSELAAVQGQLQRATDAAEAATTLLHAAEATAARQREQQEAGVEALVAHHAEEVASLRAQVREQQEAAAAARLQVEEATQQKVAALMRLSDAEGGRSKAGGRIERLTQARAGVGAGARVA